jgi:predicted dienelactone hydrolase
MLARLRFTVWLLLVALGLACASCGSGEDTAGSSVTAPVATWETPGPYPVGHSTLALVDAKRGRALQVSLWFPADEGARAAAERGVPVDELVPEGADRATLAGLVAKAPAGCTNRTARSAPDAAPATLDALPLVVFSHCHGCARFSSFTIAERLASFGFAVAAPDHAGDTLFEALDGVSAPLDGEFLAVRATDVSFVLDALLDPSTPEVPASLRGRFDPDRVGIFGHSYGGATTGLVLQDDPRPKAGLAIAAPMESPILPGPKMANIERPVAFLLAKEDNSITELGNGLIRTNVEEARADKWLYEVADAGHWSFSDLCALTPSFDAGCGAGSRQTDGEDFTYLDNATARALAAAYVTAFMTAELHADPKARTYLDTRPSAP